MNWLGDRPSLVGEENENDNAKQSTAGVGRKSTEEKKAEATIEVAEEAEATAEVAEDKDENVAANVEETIAEMVAEKVVETVEENVNNVNVNAEEVGENVTAGVPIKKKDHPGPPRRSFRIRKTVIKKGAKHKGSAIPYVISSDSSSSSKETEEDDEGNESDDEGESDEDTERLERIGSEAEEEYDTPSGEF